MSRPGAWGRVLSNIGKYLRKDWSKKRYIGKDAEGHSFYEITNSRQNVGRGFDPPPKNPDSQPGLEWQSWLKGTRRFPPSDQEVALNSAKQQAQLAGNSATEKRSPTVHTEGQGAGATGSSFPKYDDLEVGPGAKKMD